MIVIHAYDIQEDYLNREYSDLHHLISKASAMAERKPAYFSPNLLISATEISHLAFMFLKSLFEERVWGYAKPGWSNAISSIRLLVGYLNVLLIHSGSVSYDFTLNILKFVNDSDFFKKI